jgi:hypothetical protein
VWLGVGVSELVGAAVHLLHCGGCASSGVWHTRGRYVGDTTCMTGLVRLEGYRRGRRTVVSPLAALLPPAGCCSRLAVGSRLRSSGVQASKGVACA